MTSGHKALVILFAIFMADFDNVVIPKNAVAHIRYAAGPPKKIAKATPPMLPVPTVPDSAVDKAWK